MTVLKMIGQLLSNSGQISAVEDSGVASSGTAQSMLNASNITKTRKALQITVCALYKLLRDSYETDMILESKDTDFDYWCQEKCYEQPTFKYWYLVIKTVMTYLVFISSLRGCIQVFTFSSDAIPFC